MPPSERPTASPASVTVADLCSVTRTADGVTLHFGHTAPAGAAPGAQSALLLTRVSIPEDGAAQLQDLMTALLQAAPASAGSAGGGLA